MDRGFGVVQIHLGGGVFGHQGVQARHILLGLVEIGLGLGQAAPGFLQGRFIRPLINDKQKLAGLDPAAFLEEDFFKGSCHPGLDLHGLAGFGPGHVFSVNRDGL